MIPGRTTTLRVPLPTDQIAPRLRDALSAGVFTGETGSGGCRLHAGPRLALASKLSESQTDAPPPLQLLRSQASSGATLLGRWSAGEGGGSELLVTYMPPMLDFVLFFLMIVILGPLAIEVWAEPVDDLVRGGVTAIALAAPLLVIGASLLRMRRLNRALRSVLS